jgi:hypothetical protein
MSNASGSKKSTIEQVKERHELRLLEIDGVEGVGIGSDDRSGTTVIKVYVGQKSKVLQERIPAELEGYPVHLEVSGEFNTLPA